jgi:uncharacterized protein involved in exopolysaccharide biosynthesis
MSLEHDAPQLALIRRTPLTLTSRDVVRPLFQYKKPAALLFLGIVGLAVCVAAFWPRQYTAQMKILVKHGRVDPLVTADRNDPWQTRSEVTDTELNSEVELLKSRDLLASVALAAGLVAPMPEPNGKLSSAVDGRVLDEAIRRLERSLTVEPIRRTTLIAVTYRARDPNAATNVLTHLSRLYLEKHLGVHRPAAAKQFFTEQTERLRGELHDAEQRLVDFGRRHNVVSASDEKDAMLQRLVEFEATREQLQGQAADLTRRLEALGDELATTPTRQTTLLRTQDNGDLMRELKSKLLDLELKRTELARKFTDTYPPLIELDQQLQHTRSSIAVAEQSPIREEVTDQNPTNQWIRYELSRVQAEREALDARITVLDRTIQTYRDRAQELDSQSTEQQDLVRAVKAAEESYLLYQRREEESRISDALDETRIANVGLAEPPTVPLTGGSRGLLLAGAILIALVVSLAFTFMLDFLNPYFRTPDEVWTVLELPVLAALPRPRRRQLPG